MGRITPSYSLNFASQCDVVFDGYFSYCHQFQYLKIVPVLILTDPWATLNVAYTRVFLEYYFITGGNAASVSIMIQIFTVDSA
jgi:hypothetical protein